VTNALAYLSSLSVEMKKRMERLARDKHASLFGLIISGNDNKRLQKLGRDKCSSFLDFFITDEEEESQIGLQETNAVAYLASLSAVEMKQNV
jgi:hypothetical protein